MKQVNNGFNVTADLTESANTLLKKPSKSVADITSTALDFINNTVLYPLQKYNIYTKSKLEKYRNELNKKVAAIPSGEITEPSVNIWGPVTDYLKWNLDDQQKYIRDFLTKILLADIQKSKKNKIVTFLR